ncbi:MAG: hypothetical protein AAGA85_25720 [Bacteroidota bacterium]
MKRRIRFKILIPLLCCSFLLLFSCQEDSEIFDNVDLEVEKKTDQDEAKKAKPGG